jgi:putative endonuclease
VSGSDATARRAERWGRVAESLCVVRLRVAGWRIVARRHGGGRGTGVGELDIVARRGRTLAFIEVKARARRTDALESLRENQRLRIARAAERFLAHRGDLAGLDVRFDLMVVSPAPWCWPTHIADAWRP